jgi:1-acyl-sn-glycerol-3-phosphate acyltransferase
MPKLTFSSIFKVFAHRLAGISPCLKSKMYPARAIIMQKTVKKLAPIKDLKDPFTFPFLSALTKVVLGLWYRRLEVWGIDNLPQTGPFICVANHSSRFDGPTLGRLLDRPANFMVAPTELVGLQGFLLGKVGSFPANPRLDLIEHAIGRFELGEPLVIFPEGNVFYDGKTHPFKKGFCKLAFAAIERGLDIPVIPVGISYGKDLRSAHFNFGQPIRLDPTQDIKDVANAIHREVLALRAEIGVVADQSALYGDLGLNRYGVCG